MSSENKFPDFSAQGYQVVKELGQNRAGGRITFKALALETNQAVVIKKFEFNESSSWSGFKAFEREIQILQSLNHSGIPHYLTAFETTDGFCLVQEYVRAATLAARSPQGPSTAKHVATEVLKILSYLQELPEPVIHRDLKPENILIDEEDRVYLIDFGFAKRGGEILGASSVVAGTSGFMPPEALLNRQLSLASDLYSLGATIICLLSGVSSTELSEHINFKIFKLDTTKLLPPTLEPSDRWWIEKIVNPDPRDRFPNAKAALAALEEGKIELTDRNVRLSLPSWKTIALISLTSSLSVGVIGGVGFGVYKAYQSHEALTSNISHSQAKHSPIGRDPIPVDRYPIFTKKKLIEKEKPNLKDLISGSKLSIKCGGLLYMLFVCWQGGIQYSRRATPAELFEDVLKPALVPVLAIMSLSIMMNLVFPDDNSSVSQDRQTTVSTSTLDKLQSTFFH